MVPGADPSSQQTEDSMETGIAGVETGKTDQFAAIDGR
jgi:hypothetical protein